MDKTGTITKGKPEMLSVKNYSDTSNEVLISIIASLEAKSEHPIAHAVTSFAQEYGISLKDLSDFESIKGKGLRGTIDGTEYF